MTYADFLASKKKAVVAVGPTIEAGDVHSTLHEWQKDIVGWAVRQGRAAIFADCGLGKTRMQLEWARLIADTTLIVAPLSVARQTVRESHKIDQDVTYARTGADVTGPGVWITNYEMVDHFDPSMFGAVVIDECFAAGTLVDTPSGAKRIEHFKIGDVVTSAAGDDLVWDVHRREVPYAVVVSFREQAIICSPNHPWFTQRGWVGAQDLEPGDSLVSTAEAVRMVRGAVREEPEAEPRKVEILRNVLLSEMADERSSPSGEASYPGNSVPSGCEPERMVAFRIAGSDPGDRTNPEPETDEPAGSSSESLPPIERDRPRTFRAWGQWEGDDIAAIDADGCVGRAVAGGVLCVVGPTDSRLSDELQARLSERRSQSRYRSGWSIPSLPQEAGREEGRQARFARVDGVEVLEPGDHRLDRIRDADGVLRFYDLGVVGHPSFSVAGRLVHNSSILKNITGTTRRKLTEGFASVPYRLACTATPAPNDVAELCNHAEFLGAMPRNEMLAAFFVHDEIGWRPKGHAAGPMFEWMATWSVALRKPSDIGYPDDGYDLPELTIIPEIVDVEIEAEGQLFPTELGGIGGRSKVRRSTLDARCARAAELCAGDDQWIVWCGLNDEASTVAKLIGPDAVNVEGSWTPDAKAEALEAFQDGQIRVLITKTSIAGFGMNFQNAHKMAFVGLSDSYESYYQAIRRCWRFGQTEPVHAHVIVSTLEQQIVDNIRRKEDEASAVTDQLVRYSPIRNGADNDRPSALHHRRIPRRMLASTTRR